MNIPFSRSKKPQSLSEEHRAMLLNIIGKFPCEASVSIHLCALNMKEEKNTLELRSAIIITSNQFSLVWFSLFIAVGSGASHAHAHAHTIHILDWYIILPSQCLTISLRSALNRNWRNEWLYRKKYTMLPYTSTMAAQHWLWHIHMPRFQQQKNQEEK